MSDPTEGDIDTSLWARLVRHCPPEVMLAELKAQGVEVMRVRDSTRVIQYAGDEVPDV